MLENLSPGSKSSDNNFQQKSASMLVDCLQERAGNELLVGSLEEAHCALEVNYTLPLHENNLSNGNIFQEFGTLKTSGVENLKDSHSPEDTLQKISCPQELQEGLMPNNNQEPKTSILATEYLQAEESIQTDGCQKFTPFKVSVCQVEESGKLRNDEVQNLLAGAERKANQTSDKPNKVNGYATNADDTQRNEGNESKLRNGIPAVDHIATSSLVFQCNEWPHSLHGLLNQTDSLCDGAAVNFPSHDQIVDSSTCKNSSSLIKHVEGIAQNISEEGYHMEAQTPEQDGPEALWVKWRGKWQTGIRCSRADYPLSTLKAKPTHERKKYFVVFFPNTRTYSWVDMQLVRSIDELPEPLAYGSHYSWMAFVKDLTFPRRYIMQKLSVSMLDISDQLHTEAVIESARKASSWKEFAKEASLCRDYFELGTMLLKLYRMILPDYVSSNWLEHSFDTWMQQCQNARSAETIETLTEELVGSVLWSNVEELWEAPVQPELGPEWRTWKQKVMKLFSTSHPGASGLFDKSYEGPLNSGQHFSRKRPKLDIRRPYICVSEVGDKMPQDITLKCGPRNSNSQGVQKCSDIYGSFNMEVTRTGAPAVSRNMASKHDGMAVKGVNLRNNFTSTINTSVHNTGKGDLSNDSRDRDCPKYRRCLAFMEAKGRQCGRWAKDGDVYCCVHLGNHSVNMPSQTELTLSTSMPQSTSMTVSSRICLANEHRDKDSPNKYRQCSAFVEAKGRQCGRWANDGDIYCCVHLCNHSMNKPSLLELTPALKTFMCEGTTTHGEKCKHRARPGSAFCKKHELHRTNDLVVAGNLLTYSGGKVKGKHGVETFMCEGTTTHGGKCKHRARPGSAFCKKHGLHRTNDLLVAGNLLTYSGGKVKGKHGAETIPETIATTNVSYGNALLSGETTLMQDNLVSVGVVEAPDERNLLRNNLELSDALSTPAQVGTSESPCCIGFSLLNDEQCLENARKHNLYCEKHVPNFLKRARNGKSRLISKEIFINLLKSCTSRKEKIHLHQACELLYGFMKGSLSHQKLDSQGDVMGRLLSEACKDKNVGEYLLKLVSSEREKIGRVCGFEELKDKQVHSSEMSTVPVLEALEQNPRSPNSTIRCKICTEGFSDDKTLSIHWMEVHKKEAQWLFRGYACAVCMASFTNRKVQEAHVKEKHGMQFVEGSLLFRCMSCNSHFTNPSELWQHVLSAHSMEFRLPDSDNLSKDSGALKIELHNESCLSNGTTEKDDGHRRFVCRFCGLKFDLLPDLGRHHQSAHMNLSFASHLPSRANKHLKHSRLRHSRFKKGLGATSRFKKSTNFGVKKCFQSSSSVVFSRMRLHRQASQTSCLGRLLESHCFNVAETLFAEVKQTKSRPSNMEILSIARTTCCRTHLLDVLQEKHGILPENIYLKAAKLCSELNIQVSWHVDGFICPNGCRPHSHPHSLSPLAPILSEFVEPAISPSDHVNNGVGEMVESHCVLNREHFNWRPISRTIVLCEDMCFGQEPVPVACVIDKNIKDLFHMDFSEASAGQDPGVSMPWQGFTYVTKRLLNPSLGLDAKSSQLGCACPDVKCRPETCDHVYLFDNDYENAKDIHGNSMHGRFPYDERGRIIVEEGCLVYECNSLCSCDKSCQNRVLQKGVQVKLEVFRTEKKGWAVRTTEAIPRGTFVCEYIGEVLNDTEASQRGERYDSEGCSYLYDIDSHIEADGRLSEDKVPYVIDATKYGNVSRFINHSCSPNLVNYQVLVESMDFQLAHIGLYANRDIADGEELAYDYRYNLLPGTGCPCHCGSSNCRGRLY